MQYRQTTEDDIKTLVQMNRQLIEDERSSNPMSDRQLGHRMRNFLSNNFSAYIACHENKPAGYALYRLEVEHVYIRHFFIGRAFRRQGYGQAFMTWLLENPWRPYRKISLDVLAHNEIGVEFWRAVGFRDRYIHMVLEK